jgi:hypothetical protein
MVNRARFAATSQLGWRSARESKIHRDAVAYAWRASLARERTGFGGWCAVNEPLPDRLTSAPPILESPDNEGLYKKMKRLGIE